MMDPLVLLHGFTGRGSGWDPVLQALMRCSLPNPVDGWSPDLPGHGSSSDVRPESFEVTVEQLTEKIERRFTRPAVLVGYSLGARLALGIAVAKPELLRHLILISVQPGLPLVGDRRSRADADASLSERILRDGLESFVTYWQGIPLFASQQTLPTETLVTQSRARLSHQPEGLAWVARTLSPGLMPDYRPALQRWSGCPITIVSGSLDEKYTTLSREVARLSPAIRLQTIEGAGHNPVLEQPVSVANLIADVMVEPPMENPEKSSSTGETLE